MDHFINSILSINQKMNIPQQNMKLKRVLGFTGSGRNSFAYQPNTGNIIYIAGCIIVIVDPQQNRQQHLYTDSKQVITTLAISDDGRYLAAANCGSQATIYIWDLSNMLLIAKLEESTIELSCMCFSGNNKILVSAGYRQNNSHMLNIWDWLHQSLVSSHKLSTKIRSISFNWNSSYFVTVGDAHVKYWYMQYGNDASHSHDQSAISISGSRSALLGEQKANSFCGVKCGRGSLSESTFCITKSGLLCEINERRLLHKWVDLRTPSANCMAVGEELIVVGCANGVIRCFNPTELRFLKNLPRPHWLGLDPASVSRNPLTQNASSLYPSVINVCLNENLSTIACTHNDRSIYIWDLVGTDDKIVKSYSALYHSSCIWGIDIYPSSSSSTSHILPIGSFITCSSDDTLRIWNPNMYSEQITQTTDRQAATDALKIIFTDATCKYLCDLENLNQSKADENYDSNEGLRCLRISPNGKQLAVGSRSGAIRIFDFESDSEIKNIAAHDAEVLCLEYSDPSKFNGYCYMASSSRDKLIHIFDVNDNYTFLQTIDDHLSSITALRFVNNRARDCRQLISCGADSRIIFRNGVKVKGNLNFFPDQHIEGKNTFYDMEVDSESSCLITACQDRMIRLFNVAQVKYQSGFKGSLTNEGTIIKIALDPSCTFLATSSTDKSISIYDYQRGECIASISDGLSDLVTDMKFSPDGRHLIACSGDGCIFIWESPSEIANAIGNNLGVAPISLPPCTLGSINNKGRLNTVELIEQKELVRKAPPRIKNLTEWPAKQQQPVNGGGTGTAKLGRKYSSNEALNDDLTLMNKRYQVQNSQMNSSDANDDPEVDQMRAVNSNSQVIDETLDVSPQVARARTSEIMGHSNKLANAFKSRENLDQISLREKFVAQGLLIGRDVKRNGSSKNNNSSLSGQFNTKQSHDNHDFESMQQQEDYVHTSEDELFSSDANQLSCAITKLTVRPTTPPKPSLHRQTRRSSLSQYNQQSPDQVNGDFNGREGASKTVGRRLNMYRVAASNSRGANLMRPSKSECNLELFEEKDESGRLMDEENIARTKIDLSKLHPSEVPLNREFCQYLVDELQALSKYAIKLHQRLLASGESYSSLSDLMATGIQNSRDTLSFLITPENHYQQIGFEADLSPVSSMLSRRNKPTKQLSSSSPPQDKQQVNQLLSTQGSRRSQDETNKTNSNSNDERSKLQLDQVLEAYSDRLFKLVQERVVETSGNTGA